MATFLGKATLGVAAAFMLAGIATGAQGFTGFNPLWLGVERGIQIRGSVVCTGCSLAEVREAQPREHRLYQLTHRQGQMVMKVSWVNNSQRWSQFVPLRIWVRAEDSLFQKLTAEENLFKEVEITGILSTSWTLDVSKVTIRDWIRQTGTEYVFTFENVREVLLGADPRRLRRELLHWQQEQPAWPRMQGKEVLGH